MSTKVMQERDEARNVLLGFLEGKDRPTVWTEVRHVSKSGMSRDLSAFIVSNGEIVNVTYYVAKALGYAVKDRDGRRVVTVKGAGMDMGFALVYELSSVLFNDGYRIRQEWL